MSSTARRRLLRDFRNLQKDPPHGVSGAPIDNNIMKWQAIIFGPDGTIWEGGSFHLELEFSEDYPNKAPKAVFTSRMFHPNVYGDGTVCLDILQNQWSPVYDISAILTSIRSLLCDPNPYSPANNEAAQLYIENRREYNQCVVACVSDSWRTAEESSSSSSRPLSHGTNESSSPTAAVAASGTSATIATPGVDVASSHYTQHHIHVTEDRMEPGMSLPL